MILHTSRSQPLTGAYTPPGDKSLAHRSALFAALAEGESVIGAFPLSGVTRAMLDALTAFGVRWSLDNGTLTVIGSGLRGLRPPETAVTCRNSATTLRLLAGAVAAAGIPCVLDGSEGLRRRPMNRVTEPLRAMGVGIETAPGGGAPLVIQGRPAGARLTACHVSLPVASAQVKSCLLLAALAADGPVTLSEPGPSRDHTERMLRAMGVDIRCDRADHRVTLTPPAAPLRPLRADLAGDLSTAAFLIVAATVIPGSDITLLGVGVNPTRTGLLDVLRAMGADITESNPRARSGEPVADIRVRAAPLSGVRVSGDLVVRMIDEFPVLAVAAACATGLTEVSEAAELRHKESDRIGRLCAELAGVGVDIAERPDGFVICGGPIRGGAVDAHGDHRIAMALAVAGWVSSAGIAVRRAEILAESFPDFVPVFSRLGAAIRTDEPPAGAALPAP
jgi:3-phosphoshikimate 1-carboxyvinyltransferase